MTRPADDLPAADLGPVWDLLDVLPRSTASASLSRSTITLAADGGGPAVGGRPRAFRLVLAALAFAAFAGGFAWGRRTAPDPDRPILRGLPIVRHIDLLTECGSVPFLEEVAAKRYPPPLRPTLRIGAEAVQEDATAFVAALDALAADVATGLDDAADLDARRDAVLALDAAARVELDRGVERYHALSAAERESLAALALALSDPDRRQLREAALVWHRWLEVARPEDRAEIVTGGAASRLDWLEWYAARADARRGPPPGPEGRGPEGRPRGPGPPRGPRGEGFRGGGPPPRPPASG